MANFLLELREFESTECCFSSVTVAAKCLALWGPLGCPFFPGCPLWRTHSCIPKSSVCSKMLTSRGRKGLPETAPLARNAAFVLCPPLEIAEPAQLPTYPGRASPGACPNTGEQPLAGPPGPLNPPACVAWPTGQTSRWCIDREQMVSRRGKRASTMKPYWSYCSFYLLQPQLRSWGFSANNTHPPPRPPACPCPVIAACQCFCGESSASLHPACPALFPLLLKSSWKEGRPKGAHPFPTPHEPSTLSPLYPSPSCPLFHLAEGWGDCEAPLPQPDPLGHNIIVPHWVPLSSSSFCPLNLVYVHVCIK